MRKKTVMAFGTFDIFHEGHKSYLEQAKMLGDYLIAIVARDKIVKSIKKQKAVNSEQKRMLAVKNSRLPNETVLGSLRNKYAVIKKYKPDIIALGYDQKVNLAELKEKLNEFKLSTKIVRLNSYKPKIYKSSKLKNN